jgi:cell division septal protein FtsQ
MRAKKRKFNYKKIIIVLAIILFGVLIFFYYRSIRVKNIYVVGNKLVKESEILENTNLLDYPYLYQVNEKEIVESLKDNKLINNVKISKSLSGKVVIEISENKILYQGIDNSYMLSNKEDIEIDEIYEGIPTLINDAGEMEEKLIEKMMLIEDDIMIHISEIEYKPNDLDKERFMFYMSDGNYVYITLNKINLINSYNEIYPTLEGKKGILYLDSGNHFEIKEKKTTTE